MFRCCRCRGAFETHLGNNRRNRAALEEPFLRLKTRQRGFYNLHGCGSQIIFRPQSDESATTVKNVSNELERSGTHQAIRVDAKSDIVKGLTTMHGFRDHELFVFRPGKLGGQVGNRSVGASALRRSRLLQQFPNQSVESIHRWRFLAALVRGEHGAKAVGRSENQFGEVRAARLSNLGREDILELVGQLTQFVKSTRCGITLYSAHSPTDTANHFLVSGAGLEFEPGLVERLKQLVSALKEESAQLAAAILGRPSHVVASLRWYAVPLFSWTMRNFCVSPNRLSAWPTKRYPAGFQQCQNFSIKRFCSASSK